MNQFKTPRPEITLFQPTWFHSIPLCEPPWPPGRLSGFAGFSMVFKPSIDKITQNHGELRLERGRMAFLLEKCGTRTSLVQWWGPLTKPSPETRHCICPSYFTTYRSSHSICFYIELIWVDPYRHVTNSCWVMCFCGVQETGIFCNRHLAQWMQGVALVYCGASLQISRSLNSKFHKVSF